MPSTPNLPKFTVLRTYVAAPLRLPATGVIATFTETPITNSPGLTSSIRPSDLASKSDSCHVVPFGSPTTLMSMAVSRRPSQQVTRSLMLFFELREQRAIGITIRPIMHLSQRSSG